MGVILAFIVVLATGEITYKTNPSVANLKTCWAMADEFVHRDPASEGGVALGAGCIVKAGRPS